MNKKLVKFLTRISDIREWGFTDPEETLKRLYAFWVMCEDKWGVDVLQLEGGYTLYFQTTVIKKGNNKLREVKLVLAYPARYCPIKYKTYPAKRVSLKGPALDELNREIEKIAFQHNMEKL